ncbi:MAG: PilZ domain-containing protein [Desulfobacterales bacterium]|nr:PilZ domain-containing protein [Desulfobacterales bacterium]
MIKKIFVTPSLQAVIPCPSCGKSYSKDVSKFIGHKAEVRLKYKCKCQHTFSILLERRRFVRKKVNLKGFVIGKNDKTPLTVVDISQHGIQISIASKVPYTVGDVLQIEFILDDSNHSKISRQIQIRRVVPPVKFGCEFTNHDHYDDLGKYFLYNF